MHRKMQMLTTKNKVQQTPVCLHPCHAKYLIQYTQRQFLSCLPAAFQLCTDVFSIRNVNSVDPDQTASLEAS